MIWNFDPCCHDKKYFIDKYSGTIVLIGGTPMPLSTNDGGVTIGEVVFSYNTNPTEIGLQPFLPPSGWFMDNSFLYTPVYMRRLPKRQWHRSFHSEQYEFSLPYLYGYRPRNQLPNYGQHVLTARSIVDVHDNPLSLKAGIKKLTQSRKWGGAVLNKDFALTRNTDNVYSLCNSVGVVGLVLATDQVVLASKELYQEVKDFLNTAEETEWALKLTKCL